MGEIASADATTLTGRITVVVLLYEIVIEAPPAALAVIMPPPSTVAMAGFDEVKLRQDEPVTSWLGPLTKLATTLTGSCCPAECNRTVAGWAAIVCGAVGSSMLIVIDCDSTELPDEVVPSADRWYGPTGVAAGISNKIWNGEDVAGALRPIGSSATANTCVNDPPEAVTVTEIDCPGFTIKPSEGPEISRVG